MIASFVRHAATAWNAERRIQGRRDVPLSERGRAQARAWRLPAACTSDPTIRWVTSPLGRARETAQLVGAVRPICDDALIEMDWGDWEGCTLDELQSAADGRYRREEARGLDFRPPRGESPRDVLQRLRPWLARAAADGAPLIAVTHLGVLRALLAAATGWDLIGKPPLRLEPETLHRFEVDARGAVALVECNVALRCPPRAFEADAP